MVLMKPKSLILCTAISLFAIGAVACSKAASPAQPSATAEPAAAADGTSSTGHAVTGATLTVPTLVTPADNAQVTFASQPLTLVIGNAVSTKSTPLTYTFEVATDAAFANKVYSKTAVPQGSGAQTSLAIDKLKGATPYFWRVRCSDGQTEGPNAKAKTFTVGPEVVIQAPVLGDPAPNTTVGESPVLNVNKVQRTGPAGTIVYRFEISEQSTFTPLVYSASVTERPDLPYTPHTVTAKLQEKTYFWRVQATDPSNGVTGPYSAGANFKVQLFNFSQAVMVNNPHDFGSWPETAKITRVDFTPGAFLVDFDRRTGPNRWLDVPFGSGDLQYTLGLCVNKNGQWFCSAVVQFWFERDLGASAPPSDIGLEWFYDGRWAPILGYQPQHGETVGVFVGSGNLRDASYTQASCPRICERSNVMFVQWP
jgi:hypothetical protein